MNKAFFVRRSLFGKGNGNGVGVRRPQNFPHMNRISPFIGVCLSRVKESYWNLTVALTTARVVLGETLPACLFCHSTCGKVNDEMASSWPHAISERHKGRDALATSYT
jgi:hypothetical protein